MARVKHVARGRYQRYQRFYVSPLSAILRFEDSVARWHWSRHIYPKSSPPFAPLEIFAEVLFADFLQIPQEHPRQETSKALLQT